MDRESLIKELSPLEPREVLEALETDHLARIKRWYDSKEERSIQNDHFFQSDPSPAEIREWVDRTSIPYALPVG